MDALSIKRANFCGISMGGMTALFLAQRHGDRFDRIFPCDCGPASTPQSAQQWKERIDLGAEKGMEALVDVDHQPLVPAGIRRHQGAGARQGPQHDPHHAVQRLRRLRLGAVGLRHQARARRHQEPDDAASAAPRTRPIPASRRSTPPCRARSWSTSKAPATSPMSSSPRNSPRRSGISSRAKRRSVSDIPERRECRARNPYARLWSRTWFPARTHSALLGAACPPLQTNRRRYTSLRERPGPYSGRNGPDSAASRQPTRRTIMTMQEPERSARRHPTRRAS